MPITIPDLPQANLPLLGDEVLELVQSGVSRKVSITELGSFPPIFTGDVRIEKGDPALIMKDTLFSPANEKTWFWLVDSGNLSLRGWDDLEVASQTYLTISRSGVNIDSWSFNGTIKQNNVEVATTGANTFDGTQTIATTAAPSRMAINSDLGQPADILLIENSVNAFLIRNDSSSNHSSLIKFDSLGSGVVSTLVFDELGDVDVSVGTLKSGGVPVATTGANTFTENQTIDHPGNAAYSIDAGVGFDASVLFKENGVLTSFIQFDSSASKILISNSLGDINLLATSVQINGVEAATLGANIFASQQKISTPIPKFIFNETDTVADNKQWQVRINAGSLSWQILNDAESVATSFTTVERTGTTVDSINLQATSVQANGVEVATTGANTFTGPQFIESAAPLLYFRETDAAVDNGLWRVLCQSETFTIQVVDDAGGSPAAMIALNRTGTTRDSVNLQATSIQANGVEVTSSDGTTGGAGSAGAGNQYVELVVGGTTYKVLHDGTV